MATETTLVLVKPDGVRRALCGEIVSRFERRGYELRGARLLKIPRALAQQHYAEHKGKPFFGELVSFITSGPVLALAVRGENAILGVRGMMGATNPADSAPGHDPRRLRHAPLGEHRARLRLEGEREARALAVLPRRPALTRSRPRGQRPGDEPLGSRHARDLRRREAQPRGLDAGERRRTPTRARATTGPRRRSPGASSASPSRRSAPSATSTASTSSSSAAARRTSRRGWRGAARGPSAST